MRSSTDGLDFQIAVTSSDVCGGAPPGHAEDGRIIPCAGLQHRRRAPTIITTDDPNAGARIWLR